MRKRAGLALITTLFVVFMVLLFGLTIAVLASFEYQSAGVTVDHYRALEAAQAGLAAAEAQLASNPLWGLKGEALQGTLSTDGSSYAVTFDAASDAPWSRQNLVGATGVSGYRGQPVPPYSALLVSQGRSPQGYLRTVEQLLQVTPFPYALAATNKAFAQKQLLVDGASSVQAALQGASDLPGNVYGATVRAGNMSHVTGKVDYVKSLELAPDSYVEAGSERLSDPVALPVLTIAAFDNKNLEGVTRMAPGNYFEDVTIQGPTYISGSVTFHQRVILQDAYVFVDGPGNLAIDGGVQGTGTIFVTGATFVHGATDLVGEQGIAIFSETGLLIRSGFFQGALYSHGNINIENGIHILGVVVSQSSSVVGGQVIIADGSLTYIPEMARLGSYWTARGSGVGASLQKVFWRELQ